MGKQTMIVEVQLDLGPAENQLRTFAAANNVMTVPVANSLGAALPGGGPAIGAGGLGGALASAEQAAIAASQAAASAQATAYGLSPANMPLGTSSPNWGVLMQTAMSNALTANPIGLLGGGGGGRGGGSSWFGGSFLGLRTGLPLLAMTEVARFGQGMRETDLDASLAGGDVEAFAARAAHPFGQSLLGNVLSAGVDLITGYSTAYSPSNLQAEARWEGARQKNIDAAQEGLWRRTASARERAAEDSGTQFDEQRARAENTFEHSYRAAATAEAEARRHLGGHSFKMFGFVPTNWWEFDTPDASVRQSYQTAADSAVADKGEAAAARDAANARIDRAHAADDVAKRDAVERARILANRSSDRAIARFDLNREFRHRLDALWTSNPGDTQGRTALIDEWRYSVRGQDADWGDRDRLDIADMTVNAQATDLESSGQTSAAAALRVLQRAGAQLNAHWRGGMTMDWLKAFGGQTMAELGAVGAAQGRQAAAFDRQLTTATNIGTALWGHDPLGAHLAQIEGARQDALSSDVLRNSPDADDLRNKINRRYDLEANLARRANAEQRSDSSRVLSGELERARLAIRGGATAAIEEGLSSIVQSADLDVRHFTRDHDPDNADKRRQLAMAQIDALRNNYYRSFRYEEASDPSSVAVSYSGSPLAGLNKVIDDAKKQVGNLNGDSVGGGSGAEKVLGDIRDDIRELIQAIRNGIIAVAG